MAYEARADLGANWPLVAGVGILALVLFYALYIVNGQLDAADNALAQLGQWLGNIGTDVQSVVSPFTSLGNWLSGLFGGNNNNNSDQ